MQKIKVKNKVLDELERLAVKHDLQVSQVVEMLLKTKDKPGLKFSDSDRFNLTGLVCILLSYLPNEELISILASYQEKYPEIFDEILPSENDPESIQNRGENQS